MRSVQRGITIGGVLLGVLVLTLLGFTLAAVGTMHLQVSNRAGRAVSASNLARSAASLAIARILENQDFGKKRSPESDILLADKRGEAVLTFDKDAAKRLGLAFSTNNLNETTTTEGGSGDAVPAGSVHLVARGRSAGVTRTVEAVLRVPPYPWAIASGGEVETRNGVLVASLPPGVWPPPPVEELLPADILANSNAPSAIKLGENSKILGDAETAGGLTYLGDRSKSVVEGEVRTGVKAVDLPEIKAEEFDPAKNKREFYEVPDSSVGPLELSGTNRRSGNLTVSSKLHLDNALLYIDGDLRAMGGLTGSGVIVATGDIDIDAGANFEAGTEVAMLAEGKAHLRGSGPASSMIRGVFLAGGGFEAEELTLVGSLLAGPTASGVSLDRVNMLAEEPRPVSVGGGGGTVNVKEGPFYAGVLTQNRDGGFSILDKSGTGHPTEGVLLIDVDASNDPKALVTIQVRTMAGDALPHPISFTEDDFRQEVVNGEKAPSPAATNLASLVSALQLFPDGTRPTANEGGDFDYDRIISDILPKALDNLHIATPPPSDTVQAPSPPPQPAATIYDISRFIPIEDRIRVVTWYEH